jgi:hypothetical protein
MRVVFNSFRARSTSEEVRNGLCESDEIEEGEIRK